MKKIAHLITGLEVGGTEKTLLALLPLMQSTTQNHHVYCIMGHGLIGHELSKKGISVSYLEFKNWFDIFKVTIKFLKALRKEKPDVLVTYLIHADLFGRIVGKMANINKIICYKRGSLLNWEFLNHFERLTQGLVTKYLVLTNELKRLLVEKLGIDPNKILVIRNGVDINQFRELEASAGLKKELGIRDDEIVLGIIAKLREGKGHEDLIYAFREVTLQVNNIKLLIVGDGEEGEKVKNLVNKLEINGRVIFTGVRKDVSDILKIIDIFVLPTKYEGMSVALLEAMAAGKAIVTTSIIENLEVVDRDTAILVQVGNKTELTNGLLNFIKDKNLRVEYGEKARNKCFNQFNLGKIADQFSNLLKTI